MCLGLSLQRTKQRGRNYGIPSCNFPEIYVTKVTRASLWSVELVKMIQVPLQGAYIPYIYRDQAHVVLDKYR